MSFPELSSYLSSKAIVEFLIHERTDGFWVWNGDESELPEIDASFCKNLGFEAQSSKHNFEELINVDDWKFFLASLRDFSTNPTHVFNIQLRCSSINEGIHYFRFFGKYDEYEVDSVQKKRIVGGYQDITDEKLKDLKTNKDFAFLDKIIRNQSNFIILVDSKAQYTYVNDYFLEFFGWKREEIIGTSSLLGLIEEDVQKCIEAVTACQLELNKKVTVDLTKKIQGRILTAKWEFIGLTDNEGRFNQTLCIGYDITDLKNKENDLRKRESQFRLIVENSQEIIYQISKDLFVEYVSPSIKTITGYDQSNLVGLHVKQLVPEWERPLLTAAFEKLEHYQELLDFVQLKVIHKNGNTIWLKGKIAHLKNDSGELIGYTGVAADVTELKLKEEELIKSESRYKQVVKNNSDLMFQLDQNGNYIFLSDSFETMFGIPIDQMLNHSFSQIVHPDDTSTGFELLEKAIHAGEIVENFECRVKVANGNYEWFRVNGKALFNEKNNFICFNGFAIHNHDKKLLELELQKTQKAYENASEQAKLGNWEYEISTEKITWSPMVYKIHEFETSSVPTFEQLLNFFDVNNGSQQLQEAVNNAIQFGKSYQIDLQILTPKNTVKWVRVIGEAEFINGTCTRLRGTIQDIESLKKNENILLESKNYREAVLRTIPDLMFILDNNGVFLEFSAGSFEDLMLPPEFFMGHNVVDVFPEPLAKQIVGALKITLNTNQITTIEYELPIALKTNYYIAHFTKLTESQVVVLVRNMTEKVEYVREKENLINKIQNQNKALQNYAHIISHNLRSLSTNISGIAYLLAEEKPEIKSSEYYEYLINSTDKLFEFIKQISDTSSIFTAVDLKLELITLKNLIDKTVLTVIADLRLNSIELTTDIPKHIKVEANRDFLDSIVLNLLTNSIKYRSAERKPIIHISAKTEKEFIKLSVTDNGLGIDLEKYKFKLFGMFKTFHKHDEARGLGLFMIKNQIEAMGGKIEVDSEVNKGSTFNVYLPRIS